MRHFKMQVKKQTIHWYTNIISYNNTKPIRHFKMQAKTRISTDPTAEELNIKSNEVFKILMAIAAFQVYCTELLNNKKKFSSFLKEPFRQQD